MCEQAAQPIRCLMWVQEVNGDKFLCWWPSTNVSQGNTGGSVGRAGWEQWGWEGLPSADWAFLHSC